MKFEKYIFWANLIINIILVFVLLNSSKEKKVIEVPVEDQILFTKVRKLENENTHLIQEILQMRDSLDILKYKKQKVKYVYREKIKFIKSANSAQLDSIIRSNW